MVGAEGERRRLEVKFRSTDLQARGEAPLFRRAIILATSPSLRCEGGMGGGVKACLVGWKQTKGFGWLSGLGFALCSFAQLLVDGDDERVHLNYARTWRAAFTVET